MDKPRTFYFFLCVVVIYSCITGSLSQEFGGTGQARCEQGSCYPATGDLLIGREENLTATSTCGMARPDRYCVVSYLEKAPKCFTCDSRQPYSEGYYENSHRIENVVSSFEEPGRWWQAETGKEKVSIQLDLEAEFHFTHMIMTFKTFRPKAMLIERSFDFGRTWKVYRYFAERCAKSFPGVKQSQMDNLTDIVCDENYSGETPSTGGEVIFRVLRPNLHIPDPYSEEVQDLLKLTNLRINFTALHTLGDTLLDSRPEIKEKYYYALFNMVVRGSCSCYGHASRCLPVEGYIRNENMVHGRCECAHNTKGLNCEKCDDFYNDHPWRPARVNQPNECKRCNCNNHATKCHFDAALFTKSGNISGGVCEDCRDNTMGVNCQECVDFFYQDPVADIRDPGICRPCDCDPHGSKNKGMCDKVTDPDLGMVAGRCECKTFVEGPRCDRCVANYWNLRPDNPQGCEPCSCNPDGVKEGGCQMETGQCTCKRNIMGPYCDRCLPGFYDLDPDHENGCLDCECDLGGALSSTCNRTTGQCRCRPHIEGQRCKEVEPGYFFPHLDYLLYEAEDAKVNGRAQVWIRKLPSRYRPYWTGMGVMRVSKGDGLEFTVDEIPFDTYYDIILRYNLRGTDVFEDVRMAIIRPNPIDPEGLCGDYNSNNDNVDTRLDLAERFKDLGAPVCLERNTRYTIKIDFGTYRSSDDQDNEYVTVDSIVLIPNIDYIPLYEGLGDPKYKKQDFINNGCDTAQLHAVQGALPDYCKASIFSISSILYNGALDCECDVTGSTSTECEPSGGQCPCRPNVIGRRCDRCQVAFYGLSSEGCLPCDCHNTGSRDQFCNEDTGKCTCNENIEGRTCDQCRYGYWGFPQCRPCQCNGNADTCDPLTGECIDCRNKTSGAYCDRCEDGYYGDPRVGVRIPCQPCMCPGGPESNVQHADTCRLDRRNMEVYCVCQNGYRGRNCEQCVENYYGNPTEPDGQCEPCVCNNNIDVDVPGSCDANTGECLKCLYNTDGFSCEHCRDGYFGDATQQNCQRCICNRVGTNRTQGECDRVDGQCPCLPGVVGMRCDSCEENYWNLGSEDGCSPCDCDPTGSESLQCNGITGQCTCVSGRGGMTCGDCEDLYYGDPNDQCIPCDCNPQGSRNMQCDRRTGQCECVEGVTGFKCDRCARGTTGDLPNCVPCGECFDNWDKIIMELRDQTQDIVRSANDVSVSGAIKAFDEEFRLMQANIDEIKRILSGVNTTQVDIQDITEKLDMIRDHLTNHTFHLNDVERELRNSSGRVKKGNLRVDLLRGKVAMLRDLAEELQNNATEIQIREAQGAFDKVRDAKRESDDAQYKVDGTLDYLRRSERLREQTETLLDEREDDFNRQLEENKEALDMVEDGLKKLDMDLSDINGMVCGAPGTTCSSLCGGGGCGKCGGTSCDGAVTFAENALKLAKQTEDQLNAKTRNATDVLVPQIQEARQEAMEAHNAAKLAYDAANNVHNVTEATNADLKDLLSKIRAFLIGNNTNSPEDVEKIVDEVLNMSIPLSPEEIKEMADKIATALASITDIDKILNDTAEKREIAEKLKMQAADASDDAEKIRETAQVVRNSLEEAKEVQERARQAIEKARSDIQDAEDDLKQIKNRTDSVNEISGNSQMLLEKLKDKLRDLTNRYTALKKDTLAQAEVAATEAHDLADQAYEKAMELNATYADTSKELDNKHNDTEVARDLSKKLKERADAIFKQTETQRSLLKEIESKLGEDETRLDKLSDEIDKLNEQMDGYLEKIRMRSHRYETC